MSRRIILAANSAWNLANFRSGLIRALREAGYEPIAVAPPDPRTEHRLRELGIDFVLVAVDRSGLNPFADGALAWRYWKLLWRIRPSAFLSFTIKPNIYGCLAARTLGVPAIPNITGLGTAFSGSRGLAQLVTWLGRVAFRAAPLVFFQNEDDRDEFVARGIVRAERAELLPGSGVDLVHFSPCALPPGPPVFLLVARLLADKGIREFVDAAALLKRDFPRARCRILGPVDAGNPTAIARAELDDWVRAGTIEYLGSSDDVRPAIAEATAVVLPSYYREGVPRALLEGAAMGRPLIATDTAGCRELVVGQPGGLACRARDSESLYEAMRALALMSAEERAAMGRASRRLVEERFGEQRVIDAYLGALEQFASRT